MPRLILFNKPYGVLSQFTDRGTDTGGTTRPTLSNFIDVPSVYPAGRLDRDSEGLLLLTDDGGLQARIADPRFKRSEEHTSELQSLMRISYAVVCLTQKQRNRTHITAIHT